MVPNYMENCCHTKHIYIVKGSLGNFNSRRVMRAGEESNPSPEGVLYSYAPSFLLAQKSNQNS